MKVSELNPPELDYWIAKIYWKHTPTGDWAPSIDWAEGGPLIEKYGLFLGVNVERTKWRAWTTDHAYSAYGPTPLIASMRCIVSSVYGDTIVD